MKKRIFLMLNIMVFLCGFFLIPATTFASTMTIEINALIDGRSDLIIEDNTMKWQHYDYARPGWHNGGDGHTDINIYLDGVFQNFYSWNPPWNGNSSSSLVFSPGAPDTTDVNLTAVVAREALYFIQLPGAGNSYQTIIEFNDNGNGGSAWYTAKLDYKYNSPVPEPATMLLLGFGLLGIAGISRKK